MKKKVVKILLVMSVGMNAYWLVKHYAFDRMYDPDEKEQIILNEMIQRTIESKDYQEIAKTKDIKSIESSMDKNKGGRYPYYFNVSVRTTEGTYLFGCSDEQCTDIEKYGETYSIYQDEKPRLPLE
ncbi:hypothetical protein ABEP17_08550 [Priestia flexa]|uniref:DUF3139 domain-containing protein n=1 Tax=Priestia flexa TaxID=86664 RepID=A0ABU4J7D3_9BACI|nr:MULTISPECIES: hypothetical protein [Bacillaceae]KZB90649.1 hypothetical protein A2U94_14910 [Bacillus sp. VT 712]MCM3067390.1 hypothetical protein [Priestia flexa]MCP1189465.1 hypothetical protein [Priestia flexa]MDW8516885.1 hypothetical protein [Priestia flexa]MEC0668250.1 hypothetical protein [Priestia flexa]